MRKPDPTEGKVVIFVVVFLTVGGLSIGDPIALVDDARTVIGAGLLESYDSEKDLYCLTPKDGVDMMGFPPARYVNTIGKHHLQTFSHRLFRAHELPCKIHPDMPQEGKLKKGLPFCFLPPLH